MPEIAGSFSGKADWQTQIPLHDVSGHEVNVAEITGTQRSADTGWNGSRVTYWGLADLISGNGTQRGTFINVHADGDTDRGTFDGRITTAGSEVILEGAFTFSGGTGKYNGITGNGTYRGRMTSPTSVEMEWRGAYQLAETKAGGR